MPRGPTLPANIARMAVFLPSNSGLSLTQSKAFRCLQAWRRSEYLFLCDNGGDTGILCAHHISNRTFHLQNAIILGADALDNRSVHVTSYNHWDTLSDKDSVSLQVCLLS
jgi:hypothetical protein